MDQLIPGLFVGSLADSKDKQQIKENGITHIISVIESPKIYFKVCHSRFETIKICFRLIII